jgi:microcystin-dependent protein
MNKLKILPIAVFCLVSALWSESQCMDAPINDRLRLLEDKISQLTLRLKEVDSTVPPIGAIMEYSGIKTPSNNWLECNGQEVSRMNYPELLKEIGVTYGLGDGLDTFNIPDRRGYVAVGIGTDPVTSAVDAGGRVTSATAPKIALGQVFGEERHKLTIAEMPAHSHRVDMLNGTAADGGPNVPAVIRPAAATNQTYPSGNDNPHNNMQPSIFMKFYIRAK